MSTLFNILSTENNRNPHQNSTCCISADCQKFNSILTFPPKFFQQITTLFHHGAPLSRWIKNTLGTQKRTQGCKGKIFCRGDYAPRNQ